MVNEIRDCIEFDTMDPARLEKYISIFSAQPDYHSHATSYSDGIHWLTVYLKTDEELYGN